MSVQLCWLRVDLRVQDNIALYEACAAGPVIAVYVATPEQWQLHDDAPVKLDFWRRNLLALETALLKLNIPLVCFSVASYNEIPALLTQVCKQAGIAALHFNREFPLNEMQRDKKVTQAIEKLGIAVRSYDDQVLLAPELNSTLSGQPFKVFTPYARKAKDLIVTRPYIAARVSIKKQSAIPQTIISGLNNSKRVDELGWPDSSPDWIERWPAGEKHAQQRLVKFTEQQIEHYKENRDVPGVDGTSRLSPYLAAGVISVRDCWRGATALQDGTGAETWKNELLWRDFYKYVMFHYPRVSKHYNWREDVGHVPWRHAKQEFELWCTGQTGIPIIDAAMLQLKQTGWMHNRLRMITSMFLTKHLLIDWRWGEKWFMQHLVDGDFSANNGGWQWSASTGTDAAPYFRIFNPVTQSRRFDPQGKFLRHYLPDLMELDNKQIHDPGLFRPTSYPAPMIDLKFGRERALNAFKKVE